MTVSIIIAAKIWGRNLEECVGKCLALDYPDFEILILPDSPPQEAGHPTVSPIRYGGVPYLRTGRVPVNVIPTGPLKPADKRDLALKQAKEKYSPL